MSNGNTVEVIFLQFNSIVLLKILKQFQVYFELIIFTVLPRRFVDLILKEIPGAACYFNHVLCAEEACWQDEYLLRDVSQLLGNRDLLEMYVIAPNPEHVDADSVQSMNPVKYDGSKDYVQLQFLFESLKMALQN